LGWQIERENAQNWVYVSYIRFIHPLSIALYINEEVAKTKGLEVKQDSGLTIIFVASGT
jgi:hypothetical protein